MLTQDELRGLSAEMQKQGLPIGFNAGPWEAFRLGVGVTMRALEERYVEKPPEPKNNAQRRRRKKSNA